MSIGVMSTENVDSISRAQCRGARGLLDLTQPELAAASGLGLSTIVDFERARRSVSKEAIAMIRAALERGGIEFIDENGGGPGARLKKSAKGKGRK
jgi:transcriptional regulator with XRE-family HTH domain